MDLLVGILLYIGAIQPGHTYTESELLMIEEGHQVLVENIEHNPDEIQMIENNYSQDVISIHVVDEIE